MHKLRVFQQRFRLVLVAGIHCVSSSQKPLVFDFILAQPTLVKRVPEEISFHVSQNSILNCFS
jgi:hypothetical protein